LKIELGELRAVLDLNFALESTGFSGGEIDVILLEAADPADEEIPAVPATPRCRTGDIWQLGHHRIGCGDSRDMEFLRAIVGEDVTVNAAFVDPPYTSRSTEMPTPRGATASSLWPRVR
jgi:hypothetical protein